MTVPPILTFDQQGCENLVKRQGAASSPVGHHLARRIVVVTLATLSDRSNIWCLLRVRFWLRESLSFASPAWAQGISAEKLALYIFVEVIVIP